MQSYSYPSGTEKVVKLYYHHDRLGSSDYLTNNVDGKVESYVGYDQALGVYYAQARMYDVANRRFMAADPVKGTVANPQMMAHYMYCLDKPSMGH